jgi:hypothetical protein
VTRLTETGTLPDDEKRTRLRALRGALNAEPGDDPMLVALADARRRYGIPDDELRALVDGGLQDLDQRRYADFDDLYGYCRKVAGAVGVACVAVYGSSDVVRAEQLGIALQLINIMRDVREDWELGRVYIPQDELASFGVTAADPTSAFRASARKRDLIVMAEYPKNLNTGIGSASRNQRSHLGWRDDGLGRSALREEQRVFSQLPRLRRREVRVCRAPDRCHATDGHGERRGDVKEPHQLLHAPRRWLSHRGKSCMSERVARGLV